MYDKLGFLTGNCNLLMEHFFLYIGLGAKCLLNGELLATVEISKLKNSRFQLHTKTHVSEISHKFYMGNLHYMHMSTVISVQEHFRMTQYSQSVRMQYLCTKNVVNHSFICVALPFSITVRLLLAM